MSDLIALHWALDQVTVFAPGKGRGDQVAVLPIGTIATADPAATGKWLRTELASKKIGGKRATIVLPRSAAILRKLALPQVPDEELPDLVRMQAATKSATPLDRLRFDFVPLPQRGEGREVLLATVPAKTIDDIVVAVRAAGLEPVSIGLSPFGTAARVLNGDESCLIVAVRQQSAEITLVRDKSVLFSHVGDLPGGDEEEDRQWLSSEVSRAVIAADHLAAGGGIDRVVLLGPAELLEPLAEPLARRYEATSDLLDTTQKLGLSSAGDAVSVAALAAAAGQIASGGPPRIDLLNPRKRIEKPDRTKLRMILAGAAAVAILATAYGMSWMEQSDLESAIADLNDQKTAAEGFLSAGAPVEKSHAAISAWVEKEAEWTDQLVVLDSALPGTSRAYLTELSLEPGQRDTLGVIKGRGLARTESDVRVLYDSLAAKGYQVTPTSTVETRQDPEYPRQFDLNLTIPKPPAKPVEPAKS
ncbi:MAG: hypothetical protein M3552_00060 [Planctomycetota bacterium]|nr:hypothetical protein [Planctomycetaceae bacterium]MDQ3329040.1 hypothetical protein [Planctomycetota bacterium]